MASVCAWTVVVLCWQMDSRWRNKYHSKCITTERSKEKAVLSQHALAELALVERRTHYFSSRAASSRPFSLFHTLDTLLLISVHLLFSDRLWH